jgi:DNA-directed RNA polymerase specialized sigma24 family protein
MKKERILTKEDFDSLLNWLDDDPEIAAAKYEVIRNCLIRIFMYRGCQDPESLADETFDRVAKKISEIADSYSGDPINYFYGVARNICREEARKQAPLIEIPPPIIEMIDEQDPTFLCLEKCLEGLSEQQRSLVLSYYQEDGRMRIALRKALAEKRGIALNALRIRACRIRNTLEKCVDKCLKRAH